MQNLTTALGKEAAITMARSAKTPAAYTSLFKNFLKAGQVGPAREILSEMHENGGIAEATDYTTLMNGLKGLGQVRHTEEVFNAMIKHGVQPDVMSYTALIDGHARLGEMKKASELVSTMKSSNVQPNVATYNALIDGYVRLADMNQAEVTYQSMVMEGVRPNVLTYNGLINGYAKTKQPEKAQNLMEQMTVAGVEPTVGTYNALVDAYVKAGDLEMAKSVVMNQMQAGGVKCSTVTYNTLLNGLMKEMKYTDAKSLLSHMTTIGINADANVYSELVEGLVKAGELSQAKEVIVEMNRESVRVNAMPYATLLDALVTAERTDLIQEVLEIMHKKKGVVVAPATYVRVLQMWLDKGEAQQASELASAMKKRNVKYDEAPFAAKIKALQQKQQLPVDANAAELEKIKNVGIDSLEEGEERNQIDHDHPNKTGSIIQWERGTRSPYQHNSSKLMKELRPFGYNPMINALYPISVKPEEQEHLLSLHAEKKALSWLLETYPNLDRIEMRKNCRMCIDCHSFLKAASKATSKTIVLRDQKKNHVFVDGECECRDKW